MAGFLPKIIIWTRDFAPDREATSKEILVLRNALKMVFICNLSSSAELRYSKGILSFYSKFYPLRIIIPLIERKFDISHIFISTPEHFYTSVLTKKPVILTYCGCLTYPIRDLNRFVQGLKKSDHIVVESVKDFSILRKLGFAANKLSVIYPGIDLSQFKLSRVSDETFKILFASAPLSNIDAVFYSRGVKLMLDSMERLNQVRFVFLWRKGCSKLLYTLTNKLKINGSRLTIVNEIVPRINPYISNVHAVIAPFISNWGTKACPNSIIEGLASGKPVLVSTKVGISDLIKKEQCGVVFEPTIDGLACAIEDLKSNYRIYQSNSRRVAEEYFSIDLFVKNYQTIYELAKRYSS